MAAPEPDAAAASLPAAWSCLELPAAPAPSAAPSCLAAPFLPGDGGLEPGGGTMGRSTSVPCARLASQAQNGCGGSQVGGQLATVSARRHADIGAVYTTPLSSPRTAMACGSVGPGDVAAELACMLRRRPRGPDRSGWLALLARPGLVIWKKTAACHGSRMEACRWSSKPPQRPACMHAVSASPAAHGCAHQSGSRACQPQQHACQQRQHRC